MTKILIVEDDRDIVLSLKYNLEREGSYRVSTCSNGEEALRVTSESPPDLLILDLNLPGMSGFDVCRLLRSRERTASVPVIMLTARVEEEDRVRGLDLGADDYVTKPFSVKEMLARVRAVLRRVGEEADEDEVLEDAPIRVDPAGRSVTVDGREVALTRREFDLLVYLMRNRGRVLTRDRLLQRVWGYDYPGATRTVDVHIRRIRRKLGPAAEKRVETVVGVGYRYRGSA